MKAPVVALICLVLAGCTATPPPSPIATPTSTPTASPSPSPSPSIAFECNITPSADSCPGAREAVLVAVAHLGFPVRRISLDAGPWPCGRPFVTGPMACPAVLPRPGTWHGFVEFIGTDKVAAVTVEPSTGTDLTATVVAFEVPPPPVANP